MVKKIFKQIIKYIDEHDILYDYESCEAMSVFCLPDLNSLSGFVNKEDYIPFCINMAIMYVNQGLLHAKSKLSKKDYDNYILYFNVDLNIDNESDYGDYITVDVCFSRKAKEHLNYFNEQIDYKNTEICKYVEDVIGISEFTCYYTEFKDDEGDDEPHLKRYSFIPKKIEQRIRQKYGF